MKFQVQVALALQKFHVFKVLVQVALWRGGAVACHLAIVRTLGNSPACCRALIPGQHILPRSLPPFIIDITLSSIQNLSMIAFQSYPSGAAHHAVIDHYHPP